MASEPKSFLAPDQYLERERKAETRSEYWNGRTYPIEAASRNHACITADLSAALHRRQRRIIEKFLFAGHTSKLSSLV
jgi:hypothetical protein